MIHEATCNIALEGGYGIRSFIKVDLPIPTDAQIEEVFPNWQLKVKPFIQQCCKQEDRDIKDLTAADFFRYGMKFMIYESTKIL